MGPKFLFFKNESKKINSARFGINCKDDIVYRLNIMLEQKQG